jgi:hypothetical protein
MPTLSTPGGVRQLLVEELEPPDDEAELSDFVDDDELPLSDDEDDDEALLVSDDVDDESFEDVDADDEDEDDLPRLSVLKKPDPLNVTPTGVKTFFTGRTSPLSGWAISVRLSSWKPCWTSMVSPVSTNL